MSEECTPLHAQIPQVIRQIFRHALSERRYEHTLFSFSGGYGLR